MRDAVGMPRTIAELLDHASQQFGERAFLGVGEERRSFAKFVDEARQVAAVLVAHGVQPGDRVVTLLPRSAAEAVVLVASMLVGAMAVPIHGKLKDDQVAHILADAEPRLCITNSERTVALRDPQAVFAGRRVFEEVDLWRQLADRFQGACQPGDPAVLLYTSGSTGPAKGIVQTHRNVLLGADIVSGYLGLTADDHLLVLLSFSFDYGLNQLLSALLSGCRLTAADHLGVGELASLLATHRPTGLAGVPSLWREVADGLESGALRAVHGQSLRYITNSGGVLRPRDSREIRRSFPGVAIYAMYGLTEAFRSAFLPPEELEEHPDSFGYPIAGVELLLVSTSDGRVLDGAAIGELVHAGPLVARGYWRREELDARRFRADPRGGDARVVFSGDLVRRDEGGRHYFVSRLDRMLKVHGHRISPDEVSQAVAGMPGVGPACVFGVEGGADGHQIVLCLEADHSDPELVEAVRRRCRARLPSYMLPAIVKVLPELPQTANGKVDLAALQAMIS